MAAATTDVKVDSLSSVERKIIEHALDLKRASLARAARAEQNEDIRHLRDLEIKAIDSLMAKFS